MLHTGRTNWTLHTAPFCWFESDAHETAAGYGVVHGLSGRTTGFLRTTGGFLRKSQGGRMTSDEVCFWELQGESLSLFLRNVFWHQESDTSAKWVRS